ncbi:MAG: Mov34/MPN/PAD-1 family protein [Nitrospirae bacterium]|nr:Mov34/MPN/PAD-1 family protein [Nitrospirota bacterium]
MKVFLSEDAFMDLLLSSAEVFKKESLGFLLGYCLEDRFIIEHAFSLQTAKRKRRGVLFDHKDHKKIEPILSKFEKLQIVGDFHSHTPYGEARGIPIPSPEDIKGMEVENLYIIVAINDLQQSRSWRENRDGSISGSVGDFFFKISAYFYPGVNSTPKRARIYCPFPPGLND